MAAVTPAQMYTDAVLCGFGLWVIAVIENHELNVAEDVFHGIVVGTAFGEADPVQLEFAHHAAGPPGFTRMGRVLIQHHPQRHVGIPAPHLPHKLTDVLRTFAWQKHPMHLAIERVIAGEEIEPPARFLVARQDEAFGRRVAAATIGFDGDGFDIEKQQAPMSWQMPKNPANPGQNGGPLRVLANKFALDPAKANIVFLAPAAGVLR